MLVLKGRRYSSADTVKQIRGGGGGKDGRGDCLQLHGQGLKGFFLEPLEPASYSKLANV